MPPSDGDNSAASDNQTTSTISNVITINDYKIQTNNLHNYLDKWIGFYYNQTYYCGWFWTNIATPLSLSLTILTAINAAQSSTKSFIPENIYTILSFTTMILTTLNSYFRPNVRSIDANARLVKWIEFGHRLEQLAFDITPHGEEKYSKYKKLLVDMDGYVCIQASQERNFLTDWWHSLMRWKNGEESELWLTWEVYRIDKSKEDTKSIDLSMLTNIVKNKLFDWSEHSVSNPVVTNTSHAATDQPPSS